MAQPPKTPNTPATAPDTSDAFIREVDEELRRDRLTTLWNRYGRSALILLGLLLVALAGYLYWQELQREKSEAQAMEHAQALSALQAIDFAKAEEIWTRLEGEGNPGYRALAKLGLAVTAQQQGAQDKALNLYTSLAADKSIGKPFQDLASLKALRIEYDSLDPQVLIERLRPLAQPGAPWFGQAGELLAIAYIQAGQPELAQELFQSIAMNEDVIPTLRERAAQMAEMLPAPAPPEVSAAPDAAEPDAMAPDDAAPAAPIAEDTPAESTAPVDGDTQ